MIWPCAIPRGLSWPALEQSLKELQNGTRPEDLAVAEANVRAAEALVSAEQTVLDDLTVTRHPRRRAGFPAMEFG